MGRWSADGKVFADVKGVQTIFWPPGPLPLRKFSSISASLIVGRGGRGFAATRAVVLNAFNACWEWAVIASKGDRNV